MSAVATTFRFRTVYLMVLFSAWFILLGMVINRHYLSGRGAKPPASLATGLKDIPSDAQWMTLLLQGKQIGYSVYTIRNRGVDGYRVSSRTHLNIALAGVETNLMTDTRVTLDTLFQLQSFTFRLFSDRFPLRASGTRSGRQLRIVIHQGADSTVRTLQLPEEVYSYLGLQPLIARHGIRPGERLTVPSFDPVTMETAPLEIVHEGQEELVVAGKRHRLNKLRVTFQGFPTLLWLDDDGLTYREETVMGLVMERTTPTAALQWEADAGSLDLINAFAVPVTGTIRDPAALEELVVQIDGLAPDLLRRLNSPRQTVVKEAPLTLRLRPVEEPAPVPDQEALQETPTLQCRHPQIVAQAREITSTATGDRERVQQLTEWVYRHLRKRPVVSLATALEILDQREGDCSEHTTLFTALSRSLGIPTKMHIGIVYLDGRFLYHAWPVVYLRDRWIAVDPTLGQAVADATHIAFLEGDFSKISQLVPILGQIRLQILEQRYEPAS
jgi:hypothetical protein